MVKARRPGTPFLLALGAIMLVLGFAAGILLSQQGCDRKPQKQERKEQQAKGKPQRPPAAPIYEEPAPREAEHPAPKVKAEQLKGALPRLALVIDDLGYATPELVTRLCAQPISFTVAVLPYLENSKESATIAHDRGKEVILHLPMEGSAGANPGPDALHTDQSEAELRALVRKALEEVPFRAGANNHMGSRLTADRLRMRWVLEEFKARKLFFLDSRTSKETVALDMARELGVPASQRQVFLDDDKAFPEMEKQWQRALAIAKRDGEVVIIGHIYPETLEALEKLIPQAKGEVQFVKVSALVR
jgi:polysaccharide deacetylase 2 family uncharacterized protein YibQ